MVAGDAIFLAVSARMTSRPTPTEDGTVYCAAAISMRLVLGPPPDTPDFSPAQGGWHKLREPEPGTLMLVAIVIGMTFGALITAGWKHVSPAPRSVQLALDTLDPLTIIYGGHGGANLLLRLLEGLVFFAALIVAHELIHALLFPRFGMTSATAVGLWPSWLGPYATHTGPVRCRRMILVGLAPILVLSLAPLLLAFVTSATSRLCVMASVVNALVSGGDIFICLLMVAQVPLNASVRNKGWHTWWQATGPR